MSRKGNCWDNELVYQTYFYTKKQAKTEIFEYIEFYYNRTKSHSYLGNLKKEYEFKLPLHSTLVEYMLNYHTTEKSSKKQDVSL